MSLLKIHMRSNPMFCHSWIENIDLTLTKYWFGILLLEIEIGRWHNKPVEERICKESGQVEN